MPAGQPPPFSLAKSQLAPWTFLVLGAYVLIYCVTEATTAVTVTTLELLGISAGTAGLGGLLGQPAAGGVGPLRASRGWWLDVLSDEQGVSISRLQQLGFTLLLGYLFVRTVYKTVALPDWNENEILLLGLSSATFLGLKSQENKPAVALPAPPARQVPAVGAALTTVLVVPRAAAPVASLVVSADWLRAKDYSGPVVPAHVPASN